MASPFTPPTIPGAQGYPLGLTGATAATRYVGATTSGSPATGTFAVGDYIIDQTGVVYICTVAGTPGTWVADTSGSIAASILTTKGDLLTATAASTPVRQGIGTDFLDSLVPNAALTNGIGWSRTRLADRVSGSLYGSYSRLQGYASNVSILTSQRLQMQGIQLPSGLTVTSISFMSATTPLAVGAHQIFGLYNNALALLRGTADDTSTAWGANTVKTLTLTSTFLTTYSGLYYLCCLVDAATPPTVMGMSSISALNALAPIAQGHSSTGQTSLPDPAGSITGSGAILFAYVS